MRTAALVSRVRAVVWSLLPRRLLVKLVAAGLSLRSLRYRGDAVYCPVCETGLDGWTTTSGGRSGCCPRCLSIPRSRLVWCYLQQALSPADRVLHVAPGWGLRYFLERRDDVTYCSNDNDGYSVGRASPFADTSFHIEAIPDAVGPFDVVICSHVLEHVDDRAALRELHRVLDEDGEALVLVPLDPDLVETVEHRNVEPGGHRRTYGPDFTDRVREAGFEVDVVRFADRFDAADRDRYGFTTGEPIFRCRKRRRPD